MNPNWTDAQNWLDILDHIWIGFVLLGGAAIPSWFAARNHKAIKEVSDSVNRRPTALRDDLDKAIAAINALASDVTALRNDLLVERDSRKSQVDDLRSDVDRMRRR